MIEAILKFLVANRRALVSLGVQFWRGTIRVFKPKIVPGFREGDDVVIVNIGKDMTAGAGWLGVAHPSRTPGMVAIKFTSEHAPYPVEDRQDSVTIDPIHLRRVIRNGRQ